MRQLPSGTVTLLFTDIEGSTRLLHELGQRYAEVLAEHRRVLRGAFSKRGGIEVDTQGDAFFVAFSRAADAVAAAKEAQDALSNGPVQVRMGIHTGEPVVTDEGYVGVDVHRAARIMGAGHGGQVLVSETTRQLLDTTAELRERGQPERAGRLWGAIEDEQAGAPLGGWRRHRETCEGRIRELAGPEFDRGRAEGRALTLDDAVSIALD